MPSLAVTAALYRELRLVPVTAALEAGAAYDEADDIAQEAWARLIGHGDVRNPRSWLYATAHNLAVSMRRRKQTAAKYAAVLAYTAAVPGADEDVIARDQAARILARLSPRQRELALAVARCGRRDEAARSVGMAPGTAKIQLWRARRTLEASRGLRPHRSMPPARPDRQR